VVVDVLLDEFGVVAVVVVFVFVVSLVSFVFSVVGFTTVVLFSTFFSGAGDVPGVTTVVSFCSQPARSAAEAKMQNSFFIGFGWLPSLGQSLNRIGPTLRPC
jgi:hypothetical protein